MNHAILAVAFAAAVNCAAAESRVETPIRLTVPKQVAAEAAARSAGDASAPAPVLMLEGVEVRAGERLTIEVLGPADAKTKARPLLGTASLVGSGAVDANAPVETMTLVVPLNEKASRLLVKAKEIALVLRLRHPNGRAPLKLKRAYLEDRSR